MFDRNRNVRHETTDRFIFSIMSKVVYSLMNIHVRDMMSVFLQIYFHTLQFHRSMLYLKTKVSPCLTYSYRYLFIHYVVIFLFRLTMYTWWFQENFIFLIDLELILTCRESRSCKQKQDRIFKREVLKDFLLLT